MKKFYLALMGLLLSSDFISDVNARGGRNRGRKPVAGSENKEQDKSVELLANTLKDFLNSKEGKEILVKYIQNHPNSLLKVISEEASKTNDDKLKELVRNLEKEGVAKDVEATALSTTPTKPSTATA